MPSPPHRGNRGSGAHNVMGTVMLSALAGHWRFAHINAIRGDGINPGLLGMKGVVSEDAVRLAMGRINESAGLDWLSNQILGSISPVLGLPWILDIDVTVKPLYGHQEGARSALSFQTAPHHQSQRPRHPHDAPGRALARLRRWLGSNGKHPASQRLESGKTGHPGA